MPLHSSRPLRRPNGRPNRRDAACRLGALVLASLMPLASVPQRLAAAPQSPTAAAGTATSWTSVKHPRRGFMIAYPTDVFRPQDGIGGEDGRVFASPDGRARLLVGAFENTAEFSLADYRKYLLEANYTDARLDYERSKDRWFVISGTRGDTMFYERVTFTCGGRLVNSWAMLYPVAERSRYDRIVEVVARSYKAGAGATGNCD